MKILIKKSIGASLLISLGVYILLKIGNPIGPFLFAFGLLGVCILDLNLFTGKAGYLISNKLYLSLPVILAINVISGYLFGYIFAIIDKDIIYTAISKLLILNGYSMLELFIRSILCGIVMYIAVEVYKRGNCLGILLGVPLFIFCGFQHCIANVIIMGIANSFDFARLFISIIGNLIGSLIINILSE